MSKAAKELYGKLRDLGKSTLANITLASVKSVDKDKCKCIVDVDGLEVVDVRLKAITDNEEGFVLFPAVGSSVLIEQIEDGQFIVAMADEVESVLYKKGETSFEMDSKFLVKVGNDTLKDAIELVIEAIEVIVVVQGKNPDFGKLVQAKTKIKNIFK